MSLRLTDHSYLSDGAAAVYCRDAQPLGMDPPSETSAARAVARIVSRGLVLHLL